MKSGSSTDSSCVSLKCLANFVSSMNTYGVPVMCLGLGSEGGMRTQTEALSYPLEHRAVSGGSIGEAAL